MDNNELGIRYLVSGLILMVVLALMFVVYLYWPGKDDEE